MQSGLVFRPVNIGSCNTVVMLTTRKSNKQKKTNKQKLFLLFFLSFSHMGTAVVWSSLYLTGNIIGGSLFLNGCLIPTLWCLRFPECSFIASNRHSVRAEVAD